MRYRSGLKNKRRRVLSKMLVGSADSSMNIRGIIGLFVTFLIILAPFIAYASVFSVVTQFFKGEPLPQPEPVNSQTMALLQAATAPTNQPAGGGDIAIVDDTSLLPENSGVPATAKEKTIDQITTYTVRKGDTLASIAKMFDVTPNTILWSNDIKNNKVSPGDTLVILPISGVRYKVKSGDTLASIAKKYKGDVNEIADFNEIDKNAKLAVGDTIIIPDGEVLSGQDSSGNVKPASINKLQNYLSAPVFEGYYMRPLIGGIKTQGIHGHNGVDIAAAFSTPILAAASGEVIIAKSSGWNGGYGSYVVIKHSNGTQTLYGHLSAVTVSVGQQVTQGQQIGNMGSTGKSTGTHLHFEVRGARNPF